MSMTLSLSPDLQGYVDQRVASEGLSDPADFVRALLEGDREVYRQDVARVQKLIDDGLASGVCEQDAFTVLQQIIDAVSNVRG